MKNLRCLAAAVLILLFQTAVLITEANIVDQACAKTPNPPVCLSSLKPDPRSTKADIYGLAVIMLDVVKVKSKSAMNKINQLLKQSPGDKSLKECRDNYSSIITASLPMAYEAIKLGRSYFALDGMNDAVVEANACERYFAGSRSHPLKTFNKDVADVASVAAAIIDAFP